MSSERPDSTGTSTASRRYTLLTSWTAIAPMAPSLRRSGRPHAEALPETRRWRHHDALATGEPAADLDSITRRPADLDRAREHLLLLDHPHLRGCAFPDHRARRHRHTARRRGGRRLAFRRE